MISWQSQIGSYLALKIYDVLGNEVATLVDEYLPAGSYAVEFNSAELTSCISSRGGYTSGVYFYKMQAGDFVDTKKMLLLK